MAYNTHAQSPAQLLLSQDLLLLSRQGLDEWSGFPLHPLHPISSAHYSYPLWAPDDETSAETQCHQQLPTMYMNNESPSRDDSASPMLAYPRERPRGPHSGNQSEIENPGLCHTRALTPNYDTSSQGGSDKENNKPN